MNYHTSVTDFFKSPKWGMNLLLGSVVALIPAVGPIVLAGWLVAVFWARRESDDPAQLPPFDFQHFVRYLEFGLWPFLVNLVSTLALMPLMALLMLAVMLGVGAFEPHAHRVATGVVGIAVIGAAMIAYVMILLVFYLALLPLTLRATITQGFTQAFNFGFVRRFLALTWVESLVVWIFMIGAGIAMMIVTLITCYIGLFPAMVIVSFAWHHLQKQLYQLYVSRGGEPIPLSPKLTGAPPALPPVAA